ncbi:MAG: hypothetical protein ACI4UO_02905 [Paludibacteraceae bacterium]
MPTIKVEHTPVTVQVAKGISLIHSEKISDILGRLDALELIVENLQTAGADSEAIAQLQQQIEQLKTQATNLQDALDGKADKEETETAIQQVSSAVLTLGNDISTMQTDLDSKADSTHTHTIADVAELQNELDSRPKSDVIEATVNGALSGVSNAIESNTTLATEAKELAANAIEVAEHADKLADSKADSTHTHTIADVAELQNELDSRPKSDVIEATVNGALSGVSNAIESNTTLATEAKELAANAIEVAEHADKLADSKADSTHTHTIADVAELQTSLDSKAAATHGHTIEDVANLASKLQTKANASHTHKISTITDLQTNLDNLQEGIDGKMPAAESGQLSDPSEVNNPDRLIDIAQYMLLGEYCTCSYQNIPIFDASELQYRLPVDAMMVSSGMVVSDMGNEYKWIVDGEYITINTLTFGDQFHDGDFANLTFTYKYQ